MNRLNRIILKNICRVPSTFGKLFRYAAHPGRYTKEEKYSIIQYIVERTEKTGNLSIEVFGKENIPQENGFIFYSNHQGIFDGFAMVKACDRPFSPVIKVELIKIPLVKQIFLCLDSMPMNREDVKQSLKVILEVTDRVKRGENCLIFPEGTRSRQGNQLLDFKGGSFKAAVKSKAPIVPVALIDSYKPFDENSTKPVTVQVHILKPIEHIEYQNMKTIEIADLVKNEIAGTIASYANKIPDVRCQQSMGISDWK